MKTRRQFISAVSVSSVALPLIPAAALGDIQRRRSVRGVFDSKLDYPTFSRLLGTAFRVYPENRPAIDLVLGQATDWSGDGKGFSLLFWGRLNEPLNQGTYQFAHRRIGSFLMFIVPKLPNEHGQYYEAVFNRTV